MYLPGRHDVVEVDNLDKGLDLGSLLELGLAHSLDNLSRVSVNSSDYIYTNQNK